MTETPVRPSEPLDYPASRGGCPFDPPDEYRQAQQAPGLGRIRLWDGSTPWLVTRYADVRAVLGDRRFSADNSAEHFPFQSEATRALGRSNQSFIRMDDPQHQRLRRMLTGDFRMRRMEELRPRVQAIVDELLDAMIATGPPADLVGEFALPLPSLVICLLLGVPYADHEYFQERSRIMLDRTADPVSVERADAELTGYLSELADHPGEDGGLLAELVAEHETTGELGRHEVARMARLLLIAGHETTANQTALGILALLQRPEQLSALRSRPELVPGAVEELLRYLSIVHGGLPRLATEDVRISDTLIRAGDGVLCMLDAANRDPDRFGDAELDVHRDARQHVAFGYGVHQCLGQPLARVELHGGPGDGAAPAARPGTGRTAGGGVLPGPDGGLRRPPVAGHVVRAANR